MDIKNAFFWSTANALSGAMVYPLDSLKTRSQLDIMQSKFNFKEIKFVRFNHFKRLLPGLKFYFSQRYLNKFGSFFCFYTFIDKSLTNQSDKFKNYLYASFITALVSSVFTTPLENAKIIRQSGDKTRLNFYRLCFGFRITFIRDFVAIMSYFPVYETLICFLNNPFIIGGLSGVIANLISYPFDMVKTHVQKYRVALSPNLFRQLRLYKGLKFSLARSFIAHGLAFYIFSLFKSYN